MGTPTNAFYQKCIDNLNHVVIGKSYDFLMKKVKYKSGNEYYHLYRRTFEGEPWELYGKCKVSNFGQKHAWKYYEVTEGRVYGKKEEE